MKFMVSDKCDGGEHQWGFGTKGAGLAYQKRGWTLRLGAGAVGTGTGAVGSGTWAGAEKRAGAGKGAGVMLARDVQPAVCATGAAIAAWHGAGVRCVQPRRPTETTAAMHGI